MLSRPRAASEQCLREGGLSLGTNGFESTLHHGDEMPLSLGFYKPHGRRGQLCREEAARFGAAEQEARRAASRSCPRDEPAWAVSWCAEGRSWFPPLHPKQPRLALVPSHCGGFWEDDGPPQCG